MKMMKWFISPLEPEGVSSSKFHLVNIAFFILISLPSLFLFNTNSGGNHNKNSFWDIWLILVALAIIHLAFINFRLVGRLVSLAIYAQNRAIILMIAVAILYFPIEFLMLMPREDYLLYGLKLGTMLFKVVSYSYLYFLIIKLIYFFNIKKMV